MSLFSTPSLLFFSPPTPSISLLSSISYVVLFPPLPLYTPSPPTHTHSHTNSPPHVPSAQVDNSGKRKILASTAINMVRYASTMPYDHDIQLQLKPVSRKIKRVILDITLCSVLLKEGKAT